MSHEPDLNRLAALAEGRLTAEERETVLSHLSECRTCRDIVGRVAGRELQARPAATRWPSPAVWLPIAASLAVAVVGTLLLRTPDGGSPPSNPGSGSDRTLPPDAPVPAPDVAPPSPPTPGVSAPDDLLRRRSGARQVGTKTFQLVAGEWIDSAYDPGALLPVVDVPTADARRDLLSRIPALAPYAAIADRVTVVHEGTVYRFGSAPR